MQFPANLKNWDSAQPVGISNRLIDDSLERVELEFEKRFGMGYSRLGFTEIMTRPRLLLYRNYRLKVVFAKHISFFQEIL